MGISQGNGHMTSYRHPGVHYMSHGNGHISRKWAYDLILPTDRSRTPRGTVPFPLTVHVGLLRSVFLITYLQVCTGAGSDCSRKCECSCLPWTTGVNGMRAGFIPHKARRREEWETGNENVMYCISWLKWSSTSTEILITTTSFEFYGLYSQSSCLCCEGHKDISCSPFLIPSCHSWFYGIPSLSLTQANIGLVCIEALYSMQVCVVYMYSVYHMRLLFAGFIFHGFSIFADFTLLNSQMLVIVPYVSIDV